jgi:hypothetical protein
VLSKAVVVGIVYFLVEVPRYSPNPLLPYSLTLLHHPALPRPPRERSSTPPTRRSRGAWDQAVVKRATMLFLAWLNIKLLVFNVGPRLHPFRPPRPLPHGPKASRFTVRVGRGWLYSNAPPL